MATERDMLEGDNYLKIAQFLIKQSEAFRLAAQELLNVAQGLQGDTVDESEVSESSLSQGDAAPPDLVEPPG